MVQKSARVVILGAEFGVAHNPLNGSVLMPAATTLNLFPRMSWLTIECVRFGNCIRVPPDFISWGKRNEIWDDASAGNYIGSTPHAKSVEQ